MKPKVLSAILLLLIPMNLLTLSHGKICTKKIFHTYKRPSFKKGSNIRTKDSEVVKTRNVTVQVCCDGYREIGLPKRDIFHSKVLPICEPICDIGFQLSPIGTCEIITILTTTPRTTTYRTTQYSALNSSEAQSSTLSSYNSMDTSTTVQPLESSTTTAEIMTTDPSPMIDSRISSLRNHSKENYVEEHTLVPTEDQKELAYRYPRPKFDPWFASQKQANCSEENICICPLGFVPSADSRNCHPVCKQTCRNGECTAPNRCECRKGYKYDLEYGGCKPICNGQFDGCVHGTCVGFNKCLCDYGMELLEEELFHCHDSSVPVKSSNTFEWKSYLWLLLIPLAVVLIGCCIVLRQWMKFRSRTYYVKDQNDKFSEVCYFQNEKRSSRIKA